MTRDPVRIAKPLRTFVSERFKVLSEADARPIAEAMNELVERTLNFLQNLQQRENEKRHITEYIKCLRNADCYFEEGDSHLFTRP